MRYSQPCLWGCVVLLLCVLILPAWSMPPHPDLLQRIREGREPMPYFMEHRHEYLARGVDAPTRIERICEIASGGAKETFNAIAILVDFSDKAGLTAESEFDTLLYQDQTGTLRDYWSEVTYGNLTIATLDLPSALGWLRAPQTYDYYCDGQHGFGSYPRNAQKLAEDAVNLADPFVDFSHYDNDGDGYVEALFIVHSGRGAESTGNPDHIWSHKWNMHSPQSVDGVTTWIYSMEPEYHSTPGDMTCGVFAHEMGHAVFGLPDLYDYGYDSNGLGDWSLMAGGSWNKVPGSPGGSSPAHLDAWCRIQAGAASPTVLSTNLIGAVIPNVESTPTIFRLWTDGAMGDQFFLVENRRKTGYDSYLPGEGLLIYHVDESQSNNDNQWYPGHTDDGHYLVALEQADGQWFLERNISEGDHKDPYPGGADNRTFDSGSTPDSKDYNFSSTLVAVRNISAVGSTMTANLLVSATGPPEAVDDLTAALINAPTKSSTGDIQLSWTEAYAEAGIDHFVVYRSTDFAVSGESLGATADTSYTDVDVVGDSGTNYYYTVKVVDGEGIKSPISNQVGEFDVELVNVSQ